MNEWQKSISKYFHFPFSHCNKQIQTESIYTKTGKGKMQTIFYMLYDPLQLLLTIKLSDLIWSISVALYTQKYESCYANTSDCYFPCLTFFIYTMPHLLIVSNSILQLKYTSVAGIKVLFCNFQLFIKTTEVTFHKKV